MYKNKEENVAWTQGSLVIFSKISKLESLRVKL